MDFLRALNFSVQVLDTARNGNAAVRVYKGENENEAYSRGPWLQQDGSNPYAYQIQNVQSLGVWELPVDLATEMWIVRHRGPIELSEIRLNEAWWIERQDSPGRLIKAKATNYRTGSIPGSVEVMLQIAPYGEG